MHIRQKREEGMKEGREVVCSQLYTNIPFHYSRKGSETECSSTVYIFVLCDYLSINSCSVCFISLLVPTDCEGVTLRNVFAILYFIYVMHIIIGCCPVMKNIHMYEPSED